jgi:hypothetical protein
MHLKMAEALGTVHTRGRRLLRRLWWPIGPKLVFVQMAAQVREIMDISGITDVVFRCHPPQADVSNVTVQRLSGHFCILVHVSQLNYVHMQLAATEFSFRKYIPDGQIGTYSRCFILFCSAIQCGVVHADTRDCNTRGRLLLRAEVGTGEMVARGSRVWGHAESSRLRVPRNQLYSPFKFALQPVAWPTDFLKIFLGNPELYYS